MTQITAEERRQIEKRSKQREARLRRKYPEAHGKIVDFITHTIDDGTLYFTVRFTDKTSILAFVSGTPATCSSLALTSAIGEIGTTTPFAST